jgi:hypothetical protein
MGSTSSSDPTAPQAFGPSLKDIVNVHGPEARARGVWRA